MSVGERTGFDQIDVHLCTRDERPQPQIAADGAWTPIGGLY